MKTFLALYRGATVARAELVAITSDPNVVTAFADRLLAEDSTESRPGAPTGDEVVDAVQNGRRRALKAIARDGGPES